MAETTVSGVRQRGQRLWRTLWNDGQGWILLTVSLGWALTIGTRIVYPALLPEIRLEFAFGYTTAGVLVGLVWAAYGITQFPGGLLADVTTERTALVAGTALTAVGICAVVVSPVFGLLVLATFVMGAGTGIYGTSRVTVLSNAYPDNDSTAIGVSQAAGNVGNAVFPVVAGVSSAYVGWRLGLGFLAPLLVVVTVGLWLTIPATASPRPSSSPARELVARAGGALTSPPVYVGTGLLLALMVVYQSLTGFLPTYLVDSKGASSSEAAAVYGGFFAVAVLAQLVAGLLADRIGVRTTIGVFASLSLPGFAMVLVADGLGAVLLGVAFLSALLGCFPPAHSYLVNAFPSSIQGTGYGVVRTVYIGFGAVGPVATGLVVDIGSFSAAFLALGALSAVIVVVGYALPSTV